MIKDISKLLKDQEIKFEKNDIIVLYSDGITEAINKSKRDGDEIMFGEQRLMETIEETPIQDGKFSKSAQGVFNNITIELSKFMGYQHLQLDDITLCVIKNTENDSISNSEHSQIPDDFITEWNW